ncbi:MAG: M48 family metallopeptidase [Treponema sp.]|jgi:predicted metal-dependent hydrolase|nr:M48 family metallopeptidase [Treponema sp.]
MRQEVCTLDIPKAGIVSIVIERKKISSCRLKIYPSQKIKFSVPRKTSSKWIARYLQSKKDWITEKLEEFSKTSSYEATNFIRHGISVRMLGQDMTFSIFQSEKKQVHIEYHSICINLPDTSAEHEINRLFESWWRKEAFSVYSDILDTLYPVIEKHKIMKPNLSIRKMRTLWGSSSPYNSTITLNFYLLKARKPCIQYVILHEMIHFLFPHHNRQFYDFLTLYMPDWKERKKILDTEVVQGL